MSSISTQSQKTVSIMRSRYARGDSGSITAQCMRCVLACTVLIVCGLLGFSVYLHAQGTLAPMENRQYLDNNGDPLSGGLIYTYTAGTSTSALTYSDSALATANANPVVLDSAGRATIYLPAASFRFVIATSAAVQLYTRDNIQSVGQTAAQASILNTCDFRITLTSGTPITTADVTAATTIYVSPLVGNRCALYDGTGTWNLRNSSELSLGLGSDAANTNYDLFAYDSSGTITLQRLAWSGLTTRATDLTTQDGVLVRISATTARYLGTYRTTTVTGQTEDSMRQRFVYNWVQPTTRQIRREETVGSWTGNNTTFRVANANTLNAIGVVAGQIGGALSLALLAQVESTTSGTQALVTIGEDSAITTMAGCGSGGQKLTTAGAEFQVQTACAVYVAIGYHTYQWLERVTAGTATWSGNSGGTPPFSWLYGQWRER